ncbi:filamentous hemagglutinin N-terminal domain-containing protein [Pseudomonas solani]|uniref:two-partner secretion domain-containing protein n=1 Tax=Pseudomonas solani TaxID=2731552 RepID=UPI003C2C934C
MSADFRLPRGYRARFRKTPLCLAISALLVPELLLAAPVVGSGRVTSGVADIVQNGGVTNVNQSSARATINWWSFGTQPGESVNFNQPNASAITLNRVIGTEKSVLQGALNANGKVFLVNANGVLFSQGSSVNTAGFVASTLNISDEDFNAGRYRFQAGGKPGSVINEGTLTAAEGGYVALLGNQVSNRGVIVATQGTVALASADRISLNFNGDSLLSVTLEEGTLDALVENGKAIQADGGRVIMTAEAADDLLSAQVNNSGLVQARSIGDLRGGIQIDAGRGTASIGSTLDASASGTAQGGRIETTGKQVKVADDAIVTTRAADGSAGTWRLAADVVQVGSAVQGVSAKALAAALQQSQVEIAATAGDLSLGAGVEWSADTRLTLQAQRDVKLDAPLKATGTNAALKLDAGRDIAINAPVTLSGRDARVAMTYGGDYSVRTRASYAGTELDANGMPVAKQDTSGGVYGSLTLSGERAGLAINGQNYQLIHSLAQLAAISDRGGHFAIAQDLTDTGGTRSGSVIRNLGTEAQTDIELIIDPDGTVSGFIEVIIPGEAAVLAGLGHEISDVKVDIANGIYGGALIGQVNVGSSVRDLGLRNSSLKVANRQGVNGYAGALAGYAAGDLRNVYSLGGSVTANALYTTAGLVGYAKNATLHNAFSTIDGVSSGLVGRMEGGSLSNVHATGSASRAGLINRADGASILNAYATGDVIGADDSLFLGGLIGIYSTLLDAPNRISNSFATGRVTGGVNLGGFLGTVYGTSGTLLIDHSYATGDVQARMPYSASSTGGIGGFLGRLDRGNLKISHAYASGDVTSSTRFVEMVGGFAGTLNGGDYNPATQSWGSTIDHAYATGDVTAPLSDRVGGFVGWLDRVAISDAYATGNVIGNNIVGGFAGFALDSGLARVYSAGQVKIIQAPGRDTFAGGLLGQGGSMTIDKSTYYNGTGVSGAVGNSAYANFQVDPSQGLTGNQLGDIGHYANGTIGAVLAARQALAQQVAAQQARGQAASQQGGTQAQAVREPGGDIPLAQPTFGNLPPPIDSQIVFADTQSFSADINSIVVDGVRFDLDDETEEEGDDAQPSTAL